ncbi:ribosomal protein L1-like protein [Endogone sp. FLAS-F59071]|nr:ribosomal protein L1-like protein [Endogone sp. FLAS-F59071]|eukprot:RUS19469.1 ribosomal protein L1-like protein [Endogone sp. FLAS-F59071]
MLPFQTFSVATRIRGTPLTRSLKPTFSFLQIRGYASKKKKVVKVNPNAIPLAQAFEVLQAVEVGNPNHKIEMHLECKIEKSTPPIRGSIILPNSLAQESVRILVFAEGNKAEEARAAGAQIVGGAELIEQIQNGELQFDKCISTHAMFPAVTKIARILGPKGLMPTLKKGAFICVSRDLGGALARRYFLLLELRCVISLGFFSLIVTLTLICSAVPLSMWRTVTDDIAQTVRTSSSAFDFKADKQGVLHIGIARVDFSIDQVEANIKAILEEVRSFGKAQSIKGIIRNLYICSTRGPGIPLSNVQML